MALLTVYGITTCDSVRKARSWLKSRGQEHAWVDLRKTPPSQERIASWISVVGSKALRNTSGRSYRGLPADKTDWSDERWAEAMAADPMLLKRPVIERDGVIAQVGIRATDIELEQRLISN